MWQFPGPQGSHWEYELLRSVSSREIQLYPAGRSWAPSGEQIPEHSGVFQGPACQLAAFSPAPDCRAVVTNGNPAPAPTPAAAAAAYATSPGPPQSVCVLWEAMKWNRAQFYSKANNALSFHWHKQVLKAETTGSCERGPVSSNPAWKCPEAQEAQQAGRESSKLQASTSFSQSRESQGDSLSGGIPFPKLFVPM